jgi:hypothetical protein
MTRCKTGLALVGLCSFLVACWGLPGDFNHLPLDEKVAVYEKRFRRGGASNISAENLIASHGFAAADAMVPYILGERGGIPPVIAVRIVWDVQERGCDLRGSRAERALRVLLQNPGALSNEKGAAEAALDSISKNHHASNDIPAEACRPSAGESQAL